MRFAVDTGGTFTDLVVEDDSNQLHLYKAPTVPEDPVQGVLDVFEVAAADQGTTRQGLLGQGTLLIHGTTWAINAILMGTTAKTALLVTEGHRDVLLFREGGRTGLFNWTRPYPEPYVPRRLTYEVPERIGVMGEIVKPLDEHAVTGISDQLASEQIEAVAVCFLWSIVNPVHELRVRDLLETHLAGIPVALSHVVNPSIREYRRASATAIDASLKPVMSTYLRSLDERLRHAGFSSSGRLLGVTSSGGVLDAEQMAEKPIYSIGSGPAMAPVAGRYYARLETDAEAVIVADAGGTSYDISLVRNGRIPFTREKWLGPVFIGHMTGFPAIDVTSIGSGGGSIAWVDRGGVLHVGPESAGADPGPACYGRGGTRATVTDAALALGYLDPGYFLGGMIKLDPLSATRAIEEQVARRLSLELEAAAAAILEVATESMARAIEDLTIKQGIDPRTAVLVGGGGAAGLTAVAIGRRLGCRRVLIPQVAAALSATGALMSDLASDFSATFYATTADFDFSGANAVLHQLGEECRRFIDGPGRSAADSRIALSVEARYPHQIWEIECPLRVSHFSSASDLGDLCADFHAAHDELFAIKDVESPVEILMWHARVTCRLGEFRATPVRQPSRTDANGGALNRPRTIYFAETGPVEAMVLWLDSLTPGESLVGPAILESPATTVVVDPGASAELTPQGTIIMECGGL